MYDKFSETRNPRVSNSDNRENILKQFIRLVPVDSCNQYKYIARYQEARYEYSPSDESYSDAVNWQVSAVLPTPEAPSIATLNLGGVKSPSGEFLKNVNSYVFQRQRKCPLNTTEFHVTYTLGTVFYINTCGTDRQLIHRRVHKERLDRQIVRSANYVVPVASSSF